MGLRSNQCQKRGALEIGVYRDQQLVTLAAFSFVQKYWFYVRRNLAELLVARH